MYYTIYKITNKIDGKFYIGSHKAKNLDDGYMGSGKYLKNAIKNYGADNFTKDILYVFDNEHDMNCKENELVTEEFVSRHDTYNICVGGQGGFSYINSNGLNGTLKAIPKRKILYKNPEYVSKVRNKAEETAKRNNGDNWRSLIAVNFLQKNPDHIKKMSIKGAPASQSKEAKEKRKKTRLEKNFQKGSNNSQYGTFWITNGIENKKLKSIDTIPEEWYKGRVLKNKNVGEALK